MGLAPLAGLGGVAIQYGIPALLALIKGAVNLLEKKNNDPNMSQEEFNRLWQTEVVEPVQAAHDAWEASKATARRT